MWIQKRENAFPILYGTGGGEMNDGEESIAYRETAKEAVSSWTLKEKADFNMGSKSFLHKEIEPKILGDCGK